MKYKYLLWDIDGTVLDFEHSEREGIKQTWRESGWGELTDADVSRYSAINAVYWQMLERNEIGKRELLVRRFEDFFKEMGAPVNEAERFNARYQFLLGEIYAFCDDSKTVLEALKGRYVLAAVSNGTKEAQYAKLKNTGLDRVFDHVFISDELGIEKPNAGFFDIAFEKMGVTDRENALIIGDSLTSDIQGGINAGIDTCLYNPARKANTTGISPVYEISDLRMIEKRVLKDERGA